MKAPKQKSKKEDIPKQNNKLAVKKSTRRITAEPFCTTNVLSDGNSQVKNEHSRSHLTKCKRKTNEGLAAEFVSSFTGSGSMKIKLQLFPANESICTGLEKDGFCPYLELTLSLRKKISSVLKHIMSKWSRSSIAVGEPKLLSSNIVDNVHLTSQRVWTLEDSTSCVLDVFETLGRPSIFRLWYCWFHKCQTYPSASDFIPSLGYFHHEAHDNCTDYYENTNVKQKETMPNNGFDLTIAPNVASSNENNILGGSKYHMDEDVKADCNSDKNVLSWFDSCANISIGGLFSEASLQGKLNIESKSDACLSKPNKDASGMNALAASNVQQIASSILDAEDTCSPFSFRKLLSSGNDVPLMDNIITLTSQASSSSQVASTQVGSSDFQEAKTDLLLGSELYNDDRSLGLRSIKWTDSLGPFDLFMPSSRSLRNGSK